MLQYDWWNSELADKILARDDCLLSWDPKSGLAAMLSTTHLRESNVIPVLPLIYTSPKSNRNGTPNSSEALRTWGGKEEKCVCAWVCVMELTLIECLLTCHRLYLNCLFPTHNNSTWKFFSRSLYKWGNWGSKRTNHLSEVTQLGSSRTGIWGQVFLASLLPQYCWRLGKLEI